MAKPWLWRSKKPMSLSMLFPWDITEIIETISLIGCTDNECNPWSPWKQAARKQGEEHSWNWLSSGSTHGAKQASTAGETFWHNRDPWIPRTFFLSPYKFPKLPSSAWQLLPTTKPSFPTVAGPRECREGRHCWTYPAILRHQAHSHKKIRRGKSTCLGCSRYETAMHNHTPCLSITRPLPAPALSQKLLVTGMCESPFILLNEERNISNLEGFQKCPLFSGDHLSLLIRQKKPGTPCGRTD